MKKAIVAIVVMMLLSVSAVAIGENIGLDLSAYTLDELLEIRDSINSEINDRLADTSSDEIYQGEYVVGVHIKSGAYLLGGASDNGYFSFELFLDEEMENLICQEFLSYGDQYCIELTNGMMLHVYEGKGTVTPWVKPSWAP